MSDTLSLMIAALEISIVTPIASPVGQWDSLASIDLLIISHDHFSDDF